MSEIYTPEPIETPASYEKPSSGDPSKDWMAIVALVTGILGLCAWLLPICGFPIAIAAIVFGVLGMKSGKRTLAIVGLALGGLCILLSLVNAVLGAVIGLSDPNFLESILNQFM
jgi:hypothetical protein